MRYAPGEIVVGTLTLALPASIAARNLVIVLRASQRSVDDRHVNGVRTSSTSITDVYRFEHFNGS